MAVCSERDHYRREMDAKDTKLNHTLRDLMQREEELKNERLLKEGLIQKELKFEQQKAVLEGMAKVAAKNQAAAEKETAEERRKVQRIATSLHHTEVALKKMAEEKKGAEEALRLLMTKVEHIRNE